VLSDCRKIRSYIEGFISEVSTVNGVIMQAADSLLVGASMPAWDAQPDDSRKAVRFDTMPRDCLCRKLYQGLRNSVEAGPVGLSSEISDSLPRCLRCIRGGCQKMQNQITHLPI
jgi:hypothetical protein